MLRDITLGQYYPTNSILHKLDPRVKLFATFAFIISLFVANNIVGYIVGSIYLAVIIVLSRVPFSYMVRGLRAIVMLMIITGVFNLFLTPGTPLVSFWRLTITKEGLRTAVFMIIRLMYLIIGSTIMTLTTTPRSLTDALEKSLGFLNAIKVPVHEMAMMMSIALSFIPILMEETDKIMKAQMARGADLESGNVFKRIKSMIPILVPLFVSAFRRASDLAMAMEARCYRGGEGRTKLNPLKYQRRDYVAYAVVIIYLGVMIAIGIMQRHYEFFKLLSL